MENVKNEIIIDLDDFKGKKIDELFRCVQDKIQSIEIAYNIPPINGRPRWLHTSLFEDNFKYAHRHGNYEIREVKIKN